MPVLIKIFSQSPVFDPVHSTMKKYKVDRNVRHNIWLAANISLRLSLLFTYGTLFRQHIFREQGG